MIRTLASIMLTILMVMSALMHNASGMALEARSGILDEMTSFVDQVVDSGTLNESQLEDLRLGLNSFGYAVDVQVIREVKIVNPNGLGGTYTTYQPADNIAIWNQGDKIKVRCKVIGTSSFVQLLSVFTNNSLSDFDRTFVASIR